MHLPWPAREGSLIVRTSGNGGDLYKLQLELPSSFIAGGVFSGDGTSRDDIWTYFLAGRYFLSMEAAAT
jgi:hypothetical protein